MIHHVFFVHYRAIASRCAHFVVRGTWMYESIGHSTAFTGGRNGWRHRWGARAFLYVVLRLREQRGIGKPLYSLLVLLGHVQRLREVTRLL